MGKNLIQQRRGKGSPTYRSHSFRYVGEAKLLDKKYFTVIDFVRDSAHSAPLALVVYDDNTKGYIPAAHGMMTGETYYIGENAPLKVGNVLYLKDVPEGTTIFNIEARPGDGGKFIRASGSGARVVSKTAEKVIVQLPSKKYKEFNVMCKAVIGLAAGGGRDDKPLLKAGKNYHIHKAKSKYWPKVSGSAMNAVDHPFGNSRSSRKAKAKPVSRMAPPGRKVGAIAARRTGKRK